MVFIDKTVLRHHAYDGQQDLLDCLGSLGLPYSQDNQEIDFCLVISILHGDDHGSWFLKGRVQCELLELLKFELILS